MPLKDAVAEVSNLRFEDTDLDEMQLGGSVFWDLQYRSGEVLQGVLRFVDTDTGPVSFSKVYFAEAGSL